MASEHDVIDRIRSAAPERRFDVATDDLLREARRRRLTQRGLITLGILAVACTAFLTPTLSDGTKVAGFTVFDAPDGRPVIGLFIASGSMSPTLRPGDIAAVDVRAYQDGGRPAPGDIVAFRPAASGACPTLFLKRVVGLPGDVVEQIDGSIVVNGERVDGLGEDRADPDLGPWTVGPGHVFVVGDDLESSNDSRREGFGQVPVAALLGRVDLSIELDRADVPAPPACTVPASSG